MSLVFLVLAKSTHESGQLARAKACESLSSPTSGFKSLPCLMFPSPPSISLLEAIEPEASMIHENAVFNMIASLLLPLHEMALKLAMTEDGKAVRGAVGAGLFELCIPLPFPKLDPYLIGVHYAHGRQTPPHHRGPRLHSAATPVVEGIFYGMAMPSHCCHASQLPPCSEIECDIPPSIPAPG